MAKVTFHGWAKPDDPVYKTGPVIGGKRIGRLVKDGKYVPEQKDKKPDKKPKDA